MSDQIFSNTEGSTGTWSVEEGFKPFASQQEADASLKPAKPVKGAATENAEDTRTKAELSEALKGAGVEFDATARRDDLVKLAADNGV